MICYFVHANFPEYWCRHQAKVAHTGAMWLCVRCPPRAGSSGGWSSASGVAAASCFQLLCGGGWLYDSAWSSAPLLPPRLFFLSSCLPVCFTQAVVTTTHSSASLCRPCARGVSLRVQPDEYYYIVSITVLLLTY